ncbi:bifunctional 2-C-methyl-D-erythritol 4-phosphate cytidylyltransferase/2-C-methyl-D-erythritol 2,4-cyclodiphosphate synthase [Aureimonas jatrophae]|uniref:Bifunctional enzyme IspD/IspF n=1 Tax=Aureimonas jatrophae TaxID=1166073 RepID=A0A1H0GYD4_9HYPH|nr:bifunctional 2-C-methyl-D-erythritol 4-phosphate cytidylyltransferase/2-C-methyl-D-erythritol 2,4-cyclodiphosphate synthase [Aureimonas jatrophae]MBB3949869.1 2-C-methyl-D-erythritol 4-phosphate cytidylyltransferase/2-C-methyl-D-erythritol 2,4-cyclodiphosphate synthase [Aureimonas jatrophae]SDO11887.1 2-C-methyl-D-erythritol 2,4-cyclodiphosphate synthase [Aureimonas jatrophae]
MEVAAILVAAGRGERAGPSADGPKQYRSVGGRAVIAHTLDAFRQSTSINRIVVVVHPDDIERLRSVSEVADCIVVTGGPTRQASVLEGLLALRQHAPDLVLIHDAVRPFIQADLIDDVVCNAAEAGAALPVLPVTDTLKSVDTLGHVTATVPRAGLFGAQTPQGFQFQEILAAHYAAAGRPDIVFTDDSSIAEWHGIAVRTILGSVDNIKLTTARDIQIADERLKGYQQLPDIRTGNGYDVHQLVDGEGVTLCGVRIPHSQTLLGHSDADVGLHALTDALLATCAGGDIGHHFPPSDPQWRGASSDRFLRHAADLVAAKGGRICNVDVTLICEAPKIAPFRELMLEVIGHVLGIDTERVSVKATTNETIGFVGRREGIAAIATASVAYA